MSHDRRIFEKNVPASGEFLLAPDNAHYLATVLRLKAGDPLTVIDEASADAFECFLVEVAPHAVRVQISHRHASVEYHSRVRILLPALCKAEANELILEKATELGVSNMIFWQSQRSVLRLKDQSDIEKKVTRFKKITASAAKQSGRRAMPAVHIAESLDAAFLLAQQMTLLSESFLGLLSLESEAKPVRAYQTALEAKGSAVLAVGAEGDFDPSEVLLLKGRGFLPVSLGGNRLRAETAALAGICAIDAVLSPLT